MHFMHINVSGRSVLLFNKIDDVKLWRNMCRIQRNCMVLTFNFIRLIGRY